MHQFLSQRLAERPKPSKKKKLKKEITLCEDYTHIVLPESQLSECFTERKKKSLYFNGIHLRQCGDARLLGFDKSIFLWELNSKVSILNIQVDMQIIKK